MSNLPPLPADGPKAPRLEDLAAEAEAKQREAARRARSEQEWARDKTERLRQQNRAAATQGFAKEDRADFQRTQAAALRESRKRRRQKNRTKKRRRAAIRAFFQRMSDAGSSR